MKGAAQRIYFGDIISKLLIPGVPDVSEVVQHFGKQLVVDRKHRVTINNVPLVFCHPHTLHQSEPLVYLVERLGIKHLDAVDLELCQRIVACAKR
ncbi:hypothetical protein SDC9_188057 [bioreactor metagenome]|uniref:Uncharacterized protein n=1 Tax=bioreactor metagenome TaxID=1076179 RepID=A0A645HQK3_9ZZZZ